MIKRRRFSEDIADSVLDKIIEMGLKEGDRLPTHIQLSEDLGVSLPSLREGLSLLSLSGVINITHGAGTTLAMPGPDDYFKMLSLVSRINGADMGELSDFCSLFIPVLAVVFLENPEVYTEKLIELIHRGRNNDRKRFTSLHREFHKILISGVENKLIRETLFIALNLFYTHPEGINKNQQFIEFSLGSHIDLMNSIQSQDIKKIKDALRACYSFHLRNEDRVAIVYDSFGTGSLGGSFHSLAKRFSGLFIEEDGIDIHLELTGGGLENIALTEEGKTILAFTQADIAEAAYKGEGLFSKKHSHLRVVCKVKPLDLWILTLKDRNIVSLGDLKGRRIAMGAEGGDSGIVARTIFQNLGFLSGDYRAYYLSFSNSLQSLSSNEIDVVFFLAHDISSAIKDLGEEQELQFVNIPTDIIDSLEKQSPFWKRSSYVPDDQKMDEIKTISVATVLITGSSVSKELICRITEILKNKSDIRDQISFSVSENNISIPFHTGVLECLK